MYNLTNAIKLVENLASRNHIPVDPFFVANNLFFENKKIIFNRRDKINMTIILSPAGFFENPDIRSTVFKDFNRKNTYICHINKSLKEVTQRFSLAHSIGHILLGHLDNGETEVEYNFDLKNVNQRNNEANIVGSHLLVTSKMIGSSFDLKYDINQLARIFNVSSTLIVYRLILEGYLDKKHLYNS